MQVIPPPHAQEYGYIPPMSETRDADRRALRASTRLPVLLGAAVVGILFVVFVEWAATAPLAGGAVAPGVISPDGSRRTIQHLEGGIIGEILVRDGDVVSTGMPLIVLEDTRARASYDVLLRQYQGLRATQARLAAEQLGDDRINFPDDLLSAAHDPEVSSIVHAQRHLFATRRDALASRKRVLSQRINQINDQIRGFEAQLGSTVQRLAIVREELEGKEFLFAKMLIPKPSVLEVRRAQAQIEGDRGEYLASIARSRQQIGEAELEIVALDVGRADEVAGELDRVRGELVEVKEQLGASEDVLKRTVVAAPVSGTVVDLRFKTHGGVIQPGAAILDIVPADEDLLIDARVAPTDIDVVHPGLIAKVHLSAYSQRSLPQIEGRVRSVSADSLQDQRSGASFYLARVEVDRDQIAGLASDIQLVPGMPAEVLIVTGERTLFGYLFQPFRDIFRRSLREV